MMHPDQAQPRRTMISQQPRARRRYRRDYAGWAPRRTPRALRQPAQPRQLAPAGTRGIPPRAKEARPAAAASPEGAFQRASRYRAQTGAGELTPRQRRRYDHKLRHGLRLAGRRG